MSDKENNQNAANVSDTEVVDSASEAESESESESLEVVREILDFLNLSMPEHTN